MQGDGGLTSVEELRIVALTQHTEKMYIVPDASEPAAFFLAKINISEDFYTHMQTWLSFPNEELKPVMLEDTTVQAIDKDPREF